MISISQLQSQQQRLLPQQIQYQKLLQLHVLALEQEVKEELELNPMLEEVENEPAADEEMITASESESEQVAGLDDPEADFYDETPRRDDDLDWREMLADRDSNEDDNDDNRLSSGQPGSYLDFDRAEFQQSTPARTLAEELLEQLRERRLSTYELAVAEEIIGNMDDYGYLRRDLTEVVQELNEAVQAASHRIAGNTDALPAYDDPATDDELYGRDRLIALLKPDLPPTPVNGQDAQQMLTQIQKLDPAGVGARTLRECLLLQLRRRPAGNPAYNLATRILEKYYDDFAARRYERLCSALECTTDALKDAVEIIKSLNPKPGGGAPALEGSNYITPDFTVERNGDALVITFNDQNIPSLRINASYKQMLSRRGHGELDPESKKFLRNKLEEAKLFISAIRQRRLTLSNIMRGIVELQRDFFILGPDHLRPMIYRDLADLIHIDLSTISRVVNGKYVQTEYGVFELRSFFTERLETASGEDVSTTLVKARIAQIIAAEDKRKPVADDALTKTLNNEGFMVARRTVAKYREAMEIPVARLRREV